MKFPRLALIVTGSFFLIGAYAPVSPPTKPSAGKDGFIRVASGICPQKRKTVRAPGKLRRKSNPVERNPANLERGKALYRKEAKPTACRLCHGNRGNGNGSLAVKQNPPPRNFTCSQTMEEISDGQMFWIIKNGSRSTFMPAHKSTLTDRQIWQIILYIRKFAQ